VSLRVGGLLGSYTGKYDLGQAACWMYHHAAQAVTPARLDLREVLYVIQKPELKTLELWILRLMLDPIFLLISRLT